MLKRLWILICSLFRTEEKQVEQPKPRARVIDFVKPMLATPKEMAGAEPLTPLPESRKNIIVLHGPRTQRVPLTEECPVDLNQAFLQSIEQHERPSIRRRRQEYEEWKNGISTYESLRKIITS